MNELVLTRDVLFRLAKFQPVRDLRRARRATLNALYADKNGYVDGAGVEHPATPDHATRIRASDQFYRLYDVYPDRQRDATDPTRPVAVTIVLASANGHAGVALQTHGVQLHLSDGAGDRA